MLQTCSPFTVDTFSVPISTTANFEKYFQKKASRQEEDSYDLLILINPDFLVENHFLFLSRRISNSSKLDGLVLTGGTSYLSAAPRAPG